MTAHSQPDGEKQVALATRTQLIVISSATICSHPTKGRGRVWFSANVVLIRLEQTTNSSTLSSPSVFNARGGSKYAWQEISTDPMLTQD